MWFNKNHRYGHINVPNCTLLLYTSLNRQIYKHMCYKSTSLDNLTMPKVLFEMEKTASPDLVDVNFHKYHAQTEEHSVIFMWVFLNTHNFLFKTVTLSKSNLFNWYYQFIQYMQKLTDMLISTQIPE